MKQIIYLIQKDIILEWRQKYAFNGMILYVISTVFICYLSFKLKTKNIEPITWNTLFWIIIFIFGHKFNHKKFYTRKRRTAFVLLSNCKTECSNNGKNSLQFLANDVFRNHGFGGVHCFLWAITFKNLTMFSIALIMGALGFSASLTLLSSIASKSENATGLMAVLGFPVILPFLTMLIKLSKNAMDGLDLNSCFDEIIVILGINLIVIALSYLLFPFIWKT